MLIQFQLNSDFELEMQKECSGSINISIGEEFHVRHRAKGVSMKSCKNQWVERKEAWVLIYCHQSVIRKDLPIDFKAHTVVPKIVNNF